LDFWFLNSTLLTPYWTAEIRPTVAPLLPLRRVFERPREKDELGLRADEQLGPSSSVLRVTPARGMCPWLPRGEFARAHLWNKLGARPLGWLANL
jgi:hypothetical protein